MRESDGPWLACGHLFAIARGAGHASRYNWRMSTDVLVTIDPDIQGGTPCFAGTRVPVRSLFDALKRGRSVDYFLAQFPAVTREQVDAVLDRDSAMLLAGGHAA